MRLKSNGSEVGLVSTNSREIVPNTTKIATI